MSQDIFFELGLEELPSGLVKPLGQQLLKQVLSKLESAHLGYVAARYFATPRRLAFWVEQVDSQQPNQSGTKRGPAKVVSHDAEGQPTQALLGFARSCGVPVDALRLDEQEKGAWWVYDYEEKGQSTKDLLALIIQEALSTLSIPKPMRWGNEKYQFARPIHWAILLWGHEVIPASFFGIHTHSQSHGHRFLHPEAVNISTPTEYERLLKEAKVWVDFDARRNEIQRQIHDIAEKNHWVIPSDEALLDELASIVEWPVAMVGQFDPVFLEVPEEVLIASMKGHQKCLPIYNRHQELQPCFIFVSNIESIDPSSVIQGNEKVMHARLSDAAFFYQQDRKIPLSDYAPLTKKVLFEKKLGTLWDKTQRIQKIMTYLTPHLGLHPQAVERAVLLSKCDLMTQMVSEFPELQGQMGAYYAEKDGETHSIPKALFEQYLPRFSGDSLPETDLGFALSLADRLDTLVGIFAIGLKPTGEKDPYKLRRHALAVVRLILQKPNDLKISELLHVSAQAYDFLNIDPKLLEDVKVFIIERMQSHYQAHGLSPEFFQAGLAVQNDQWFDLSLRLTAFNEFMDSEHSEALFQGAKRVRQILAQVSEPIPQAVDVTLLQESSEKQLWHVLQEVKLQSDHFIQLKNYAHAFHQLLQLLQPLNMFFEHVFVMTDNLPVRANRLSLLKHLQNMFYAIIAMGS